MYFASIKCLKKTQRYIFIKYFCFYVYLIVTVNKLIAKFKENKINFFANWENWLNSKIDFPNVQYNYVQMTRN